VERLLPFVVGVALTGCVLEDVDLEGRACPCGQGWVCDEPRAECVRAPRDTGPPDAGPGDAGPMEGGIADAGPLDGGAGDAGPMDGGTGDAASSDGGTGDAGGADAGPPDAGPDETACDDAHAGALFCDGFESPGLIAWDRTMESSGTVTRSTTRSHRGVASLHAATTARSGKASLSSGLGVMATSGELWLRAWVYLPGGYPLDTVSVLWIGENDPPYAGVSLQATAGEEPHFWVGPEGSPVGSVTLTLPRDRWFCFEGHVVVSDTAGEAEMFVDGVRAGGRTGWDTLPGGGFSHVTTGIEWTSTGQRSAEVRVDEVVVDDAPIGCTP